MRNFEVIDREYVNPVDLSVLGQTFNTLEQGHQKSIAAAAELETAMANLDLNEAEFEWRQQKINDIRKIVEDNSLYGNAYHAYDDIISKSGQIASDQGMIGRLQAQKDYKAYLDNLNKRTDISEADKEYFREVNQYYYQDKYNDKGQIIGSTKWQPLDREVASVDLSKLMTKALQIAAKDAGGSNTIHYKDAAGNYTTNAELSEDGLPYVNKSGKYERLTKDKIKAAMQTVIANTPGAIQGIAQDYKIAKWRHDKNSNNSKNLIIDETTDEKGLPLNQEQYLEKRLTGFYQSASYNHYYENIEPLAGMSVSAKNAKLKATQGGNKDAVAAIYNANNTAPGGFYVKRNNSLSSAVAEYKAATSMLNGEANRLGIKFDINDVTSSYNQIEDYYKKQGMVIPKAIYDTYNSYLKGVEKYNQLVPADGKNDIKESLDFVSALENGIDPALYKNNTYVEKYNKYLADAYKDKEEIPIYFNVDFNTATKNFDYKSYGLVEKINENGNKHLVLPKKYSNNILQVSQAIQGVIDINNWSKIPGEKVRAYQKNYNNKVFSDILELYNEANLNLNSKIDNVEELVPLEIVNQMDVIQTMAENGVTSGKYSDLKSARDDAEYRLNASFHNAKGHQLELYIGSDANHAQFEIDPNKRFAALAAAQAIQKVKPELVTIGYDKNTLKTVISVQLNKTAEDDPAVKSYLKQADINDYSFTIITDGMFNNADKNELMQIPDFKNNIEFTESITAGMNKFTNKDGSIIHRLTDGSYVLEREGIALPIGESTAKNIYGINNMVDDIKYKYMQLSNQYKDKIPEDIIDNLQIKILNLVKGYSPIDYDAKDYNSLSAYGKKVFEYLDNVISE